MIQKYRAKIIKFLFFFILSTALLSLFVGSGKIITGFSAGVCIGLVNILLLFSSLPEVRLTSNFILYSWKLFFARIFIMSLLFFFFVFWGRVNPFSFLAGLIAAFISVGIVIFKSLMALSEGKA